MTKRYHCGEELSSEDFGLSFNEMRKWSLEEFARMGAKAILETALAEEVKEFIGRERYERSGSANGYRNGKRKRNLQLGCGLIEIGAPKVTGAPLPFRSEVLPAWKRRGRELEEAIPQLYAEGLSTRDFRRALAGLWGDIGLSRSSISRANKALYEDFRLWRKRDLSGEDILYLFCDGVYLKMRTGNSSAEAVLVAHGIDRSGKRVLLGIALGGRESEESWKSLLLNLQERGLKEPGLAITDGNAGLIKALKCVWKDVPRQRCIAHKMRNVLDRVPRKRQAEVKRDVVKIFYAADLSGALEAVKRFEAKYGKEFPSACGTLAKDLSDCLTFYYFPQEHWKRLRTSNVIERAFREVRRRTNVVGRFPNENSALVLIWASIEGDRLKWRGIRMSEELVAKIIKVREEVREKRMDLSMLDIYLEAA